VDATNDDPDPLVGTHIGDLTFTVASAAWPSTPDWTGTDANDAVTLSFNVNVPFSYTGKNGALPPRTSTAVVPVTVEWKNDPYFGWPSAASALTPMSPFDDDIIDVSDAIKTAMGGGSSSDWSESTVAAIAASTALGNFTTKVQGWYGAADKDSAATPGPALTLAWSAYNSQLNLSSVVADDPAKITKIQDGTGALGITSTPTWNVNHYDYPTTLAIDEQVLGMFKSNLLAANVTSGLVQNTLTARLTATYKPGATTAANARTATATFTFLLFEDGQDDGIYCGWADLDSADGANALPVPLYNSEPNARAFTHTPAAYPGTGKSATILTFTNLTVDGWTKPFAQALAAGELTFRWGTAGDGVVASGKSTISSTSAAGATPITYGGITFSNAVADSKQTAKVDVEITRAAWDEFRQNSSGDPATNVIEVPLQIVYKPAEETGASRAKTKSRAYFFTVSKAADATWLAFPSTGGRVTAGISASYAKSVNLTVATGVGGDWNTAAETVMNVADLTDIKFAGTPVNGDQVTWTVPATLTAAAIGLSDWKISDGVGGFTDGASTAFPTPAITLSDIAWTKTAASPNTGKLEFKLSDAKAFDALKPTGFAAGDTYKCTITIPLTANYQGASGTATPARTTTVNVVVVVTVTGV